MVAREGAQVVILDIQDQAAQETLAIIKVTGGVGHFHQTDVLKPQDVYRAFDAIKADVGPYDILFNHAGLIILKPPHDSTEDDYDRLMGTTGALLHVQRRDLATCTDHRG